MSTKASNIVLVLHILLEGCCVIAQFSTTPMNAAGKVGDQIIFNCSSSSTTLPGWKFSLDGANFQVIAGIGSCTPSPTITQFRFESSGIGSCNVIVDDITTSEAGVYTCVDSSLSELNAQLTVIESISVSVIPNTPDVLRDELLNMTCTVRFGAASSPSPPMFPSLIWTNTSDNSNITGLVTAQSPSNITSYINVIAIPPTVLPYLCIAYFKEFNVSGNWANNTPTNTFSQNTPQLPVLYGPTVFTNHFTDVCIFEPFTLTCNASSYPPVQFYSWIETTTNKTITNEANVRIYVGGRYKCSAYNTIRGIKTWDSSDIVKIRDISECIAGFVVLICISSNLIPTIIFVICCACCEKFRQRMNDRFPDLKRMLPCLNDEAYSGWKCLGWIILFIIISIFTGVIYFPTLVIMAYCCEGKYSILAPLCIAGIVLLPLNLIAMIVFIICYACCKDLRKRLNDRFPDLERMVPCLNDKEFKFSGWTVRFIFISVFVGIFYFPTIVIKVYCCNPKNSSQEIRTDQELSEKRNGKGEDNVQTTTQTDSPISLKRDTHQDTINQDHSPYLKPHRRQEQKSSSPANPYGTEYAEFQPGQGNVIPKQFLDSNKEQGSHYHDLKQS